MNPFLSKRFLIVTFIFVLCLFFTFFIFTRGSTEDWQWQNHNENSSPIGSYDFTTTFPAENGMLIVAKKVAVLIIITLLIILICLQANMITRFYLQIIMACILSLIAIKVSIMQFVKENNV
ncbi:hypothetical protein J4731_00940 [Providencia rettgeri]|nr:hypothetical protein [Providencia rettgeri]